MDLAKKVKEIENRFRAKKKCYPNKTPYFCLLKKKREKNNI